MASRLAFQRPRSDTFLIVARSFAWKQFGYRLRWLEWHSLQLGRKKEKREWSMGPHGFHGLQAALCARTRCRVYAGPGTGPSWVVPFRWRVHNTHLSLLYPLVAPLLRTLLNIATREISFHYLHPSAEVWTPECNSLSCNSLESAWEFSAFSLSPSRYDPSSASSSCRTSPFRSVVVDHFVRSYRASSRVRDLRQ